MSTPREPTREELQKQIRDWLSRRRSESVRARSQRRQLPQGLTLKQLGEWSTAELRKFVRFLPAFEAFEKHRDGSVPTIPPEHRALARQLRQRQGTQLADFDTFHRERDQLDRRLLSE